MESPLVFEFEESVFEGGGRGQKDPASLPPAYRARCCEPQWFCEETDCEDEAESINIKKFRGDLAYHQQEFKKALCEYSSCLALLPPSNVAMRRDIQESQARCLAHVGLHKEALEITEMLRSGATNTDHVTTVLALQLTVHCTADHTEEMIECLKQLISLHPFHPGYWKLLAEAYVSLLPFPLPLWASEGDLLQSSGLAVLSEPLGNGPGFQHCKKHTLREDCSLPLPSKTNGSFVSAEESHRVEGRITDLEKLEPQHVVTSVTFGTVQQEEIWIWACAAFVRARLLFQLLQPHQSSFVLESNLKAQQEIEEKVASFGLRRDVLLLVTEVMGEDITPEKLKEDTQAEVKCIGPSALASLMSTLMAGFEQKWFQKLRDQLSCMAVDCCRHTSARILRKRRVGSVQISPPCILLVSLPKSEAFFRRKRVVHFLGFMVERKASDSTGQGSRIEALVLGPVDTDTMSNGAIFLKILKKCACAQKLIPQTELFWS